MGRQRKSKIKNKGNTIKNLNQRILQVFYNNPNKNFNHKQIAAKLDIQDSDGRNQIIRALRTPAFLSVLLFGINLALVRRFAEAGIGFAYPTRTLFVEKMPGSDSPES